MSFLPVCPIRAAFIPFLGTGMEQNFPRQGKGSSSSASTRVMLKVLYV